MARGARENRYQRRGDGAFTAVPTRRVSSIRYLPKWSADSESPHPFVAAQRAIIAMGEFDRKTYSDEAFWIGSEDTVNLFPKILLACLRRQESYIKKFMYKEKSVKDRVMSWMDRAATKYHFACSGHIHVEEYDGHNGYNFVDSVRSTSWTSSMLGTYVIPSTLATTRHWVSFCLSVLAYACTVTGNPIEGEASALKPIFSANREHIPQAEKEQIDLLKEAIYVLYGKQGIRFFPPRPGGHLSDNEFVIPSFTSGSKGDWSSRHYVSVLIEHN